MKAFPSENVADKQYNYINKGMDLRDYFASKALSIVGSQYPSASFIGMAEIAYEIADAMMAERDKK